MPGAPMQGSPDDPSTLSRRKVDHLELCRDEAVEARQRTTLLDQVHLLHDSLPELDVDAIDLSTELLGRRLAVPFMISGMTGGAAQAREVNRVLAAVANDRGMAFGVGSQRAMMRDPELAATYAVRDVAPDVLLLGNIGGVQAAESSTAQIRELVDAIEADALCVHLNPGQEIVQGRGHGDRDFRGVADAIARLVSDLGVPVVVKETGCGLGPRTLDRLSAAGARTVDVSGLGGTTWVGVETLRGEGVAQSVGDVLWDWGVPTAASVAWAAERGFDVIASGGLRTGLDAARALALGASVASAALPWLRAAMNGGRDAAEQVADTFAETLRAVMLLTGSADLAALRAAPRVIGPDLTRWIHAGANR